MKQVKSVALAAVLFCTLSAGVYGGEMGSPGFTTINPGDAPPTLIDPTPSPTPNAATALRSNGTNDVNAITEEILLVLLRLF